MAIVRDMYPEGTRDATRPRLTTDILKPTSGGGSFGFNESISELIQYGGRMADYAADKEEGAWAEQKDVVGRGMAEANKPTLTQADIDNMLGDQIDATGGQYLDNMNNLRDYLGAAGITGGGIGAAMAQQYAQARSGQVMDARRSTMIEKAKMDAADRARNFQNTLAYASTIKGPSMIGMDWLQNVLELRLAQKGLRVQEKSAKNAAKAAQTGGIISGIGGVLGGIIGAL